MTIAAVVLTHNQIVNGRQDLFKETVESLREPGVSVYVVDNNSNDGTEKLVAEMGGFCSTDGNTTSGHGTNICARVAVGSGADLCVLSDDDMFWKPGWAENLQLYWITAPAQVALIGCHVEPDYPWNKDEGLLSRVNGGRLRRSTGAASWSFRPEVWPKIGPVPQKIQGVGDVPTCERIWANGMWIGQVGLATHRGESTWGNRSHEYAA